MIFIEFMDKNKIINDKHNESCALHNMNKTMNKTLKNLYTWLLFNKLIINLNKTNSLIFNNNKANFYKIILLFFKKM